MAEAHHRLQRHEGPGAGQRLRMMKAEFAIIAAMDHERRLGEGQQLVMPLESLDRSAGDDMASGEALTRQAMAVHVARIEAMMTVLSDAECDSIGEMMRRVGKALEGAGEAGT